MNQREQVAAIIIYHDPMNIVIKILNPKIPKTVGYGWKRSLLVPFPYQSLNAYSHCRRVKHRSVAFRFLSTLLSIRAPNQTVKPVKFSTK
jgi:hypothetical protein